MANPTKPTSPHVLIFPLPLQGPLNSMLSLAELLCLSRIKTTFLNTTHVQARLSACSSAPDYLAAHYPGLFRFETIPDGLPPDNPRTGDEIPNLLESIDRVAVPIFREMVTRGAYGPGSDEPVTCVIADGIFTFAVEIAAEVGVPLLYFDTISPCGLWTYSCLPKLIEAGEIPFKDDNLDEIITNLPGMEGIIRRRDLPSFCRTKDINDHIIQLALKKENHIPLSQGLIFNTFQDLEGPILSQLLTLGPKLYAVGPLHAHLKSRLGLEAARPATVSNSIWKEDASCISWLNAQPPRSVIYVSIGSMAVIRKDQLLEIWHGLVDSGSRFLWVQRPGSVVGPVTGDEVPPELSVSTEERGRIVSWAPQEEVLGHPAVGGFLTHSGWNSTLESIVEGKPMICWPYFVDQQVNSRYVDAVWGVGLDMKDTCDRTVVERMVREIMVGKKDGFLERAGEMAKLAKASVSRGGSSFADMDRLIEDIKLMKLPTPKK
uniref:Glycosyltransferase n=1 Tax=Centranthera grandiflora TaxID=2491184 RepID=A0A5S9H941_9LAMI|nr:7-deoxyloganetic acid glucosyltransferase 4 [Centranthera grandiflora]